MQVAVPSAALTGGGGASSPKEVTPDMLLGALKGLESCQDVSIPTPVSSPREGGGVGRPRSNSQATATFSRSGSVESSECLTAPRRFKVEAGKVQVAAAVGCAAPASPGFMFHGSARRRRRSSSQTREELEADEMLRLQLALVHRGEPGGKRIAAHKQQDDEPAFSGNRKRGASIASAASTRSLDFSDECDTDGSAGSGACAVAVAAVATVAGGPSRKRVRRDSVREADKAPVAVPARAQKFPADGVFSRQLDGKLIERLAPSDGEDELNPLQAQKLLETTTSLQSMGMHALEPLTLYTRQQLFDLMSSVTEVWKNSGKSAWKKRINKINSNVKMRKFPRGVHTPAELLELSELEAKIRQREIWERQEKVKLSIRQSKSRKAQQAATA